ncbi:caspase family protein [Candidatus Berkiella aquae]|uniref:Caspase domain protein n=1 Tax=Candidatus Berkiella aquae TaxID=295108 RepID=A0A0Q9YKL1_9GAMM|nr:caspase family protein [Candidatus Berkiella aquae]MCS5711118.1 caspase family protein [Candidatus Berkiella aquae]
MANYYGLLVGINYVGTSNKLNGCVEDIEEMAKILQKGGVPAKNIQVLSDDYEGVANAPTKDNILNALNSLVAKAKPDDIIFFHYSGHGTNSLGQQFFRKVEGEAICALNNSEIELIADYELHNVIKKLVPGARFVSALDCCHSGDMFNLENNLYEKNVTHSDRGLHHPVSSSSKESQVETVTPQKEKKKASHDKHDKHKHVKKEKEKKGHSQHHQTQTEPASSTEEKGLLENLQQWLHPSSSSSSKPSLSANLHGYAVVLSGCLMKQTSADTVISGQAQGAFTACLRAMIEKYGFHKILDVFLSGSKAAMKPLNDEMIAWLNSRGYEQRPDFSFEGQLAAKQKKIMAPVTTGVITEEEAKPYLLGFAQYLRDNAGLRPVQVSQGETARNDEQQLQFPRRRVH